MLVPPSTLHRVFHIIFTPTLGVVPCEMILEKETEASGLPGVLVQVISRVS